MRDSVAIGEVLRILFESRPNHWQQLTDNSDRYQITREIHPKSGIFLYPTKRNTKEILTMLLKALRVFNINTATNPHVATVSVSIHRAGLTNETVETYDVATQAQALDVALNHENTLVSEPSYCSIKLIIPGNVYREQIKPFINTTRLFEDETLEQISCRIAAEPPTFEPPQISEADAHRLAISWLFDPNYAPWNRSHTPTHGDRVIREISIPAHLTASDLVAITGKLSSMLQALNFDFVQRFGMIWFGTQSAGVNLSQLARHTIHHIMQISHPYRPTLTIKLRGADYDTYLAPHFHRAEELCTLSLEDILQKNPQMIKPVEDRTQGLQILAASYFDSDDEDEKRHTRENSVGSSSAPMMVFDARGYNIPANRYKKWLEFNDEQKAEAVAVQRVQQTTPLQPTAKKPIDEEKRNAEQANAKVTALVKAIKIGNSTLASMLWNQVKASTALDATEISRAVLAQCDISALPTAQREKIERAKFYTEFMQAAAPAARMGM